MNISSEVMDAALVAFSDQAALPGTIHEYNLRAALEAALPIVAAQAWDEGVRAEYERDYSLGDVPVPNPYRCQQ